MKYKAIESNNKNTCTGCINYRLGGSCFAFIKKMMKEGFPHCSDGYIYMEECNIALLQDIRKFFRRLPSEWYPETLVERLDEALEESI